MMKSFRALLILSLFSLSVLMFFPKTLADTSDSVGFNSTPIENNEQFVTEIFRCRRVIFNPQSILKKQCSFDLIVAMAAYELHGDNPRFAKEGNNFGIRTWDLENDPMKAKTSKCKLGSEKIF